jgi:signal-transduction protein with cAMP-binding, CBS, and nucleotidyltransferase domain
MIVEHILNRKGHDVITTEPGRSLAETARLLDDKRIGAMVVSDADHPVLGIISERDIARAVARRGAAALDELVSKHMTAKVITCTRRSSVSDLMELMTDRRVRHVPVVEGGRVVGIISIGDIVKNRLTELEAEQDAIREYTTGATNPGQRF